MRIDPRVAPVLGFTLMASGGVLSGQTRSVMGLAIDSASGKPQAGAVIYLDRTPSAQRTGKDGKFTVAAATHELTFVVRLAGYVPARVVLAPGAANVDVGTVRLRRVKNDADRFAVQADDIRLHPQLASFYERKANLRQGIFLTPDDLERSGSIQLSEVIRRTPGMQRMCLVNRQGQLDCGRTTDRGPTTIMNAPAPEPTCVTSVWYYGIGPARPSLDEVRMDEVIAVEGYERPGSTPPEFAGGNCGVIVLWMKPANQ